MQRKNWQAFTGLQSQSFVRDLMPQALAVIPNDLYDMAQHRRDERMRACGGSDPIGVCIAYAQDELVYDAQGRIVTADAVTYAKTPREGRVNKFGLSYRRDARLWLHRAMADVTVATAIELYKTHGWQTILYDGLRTVDGAYALYLNARDSDMESGLLSLPGRSSHNKGMAIDSMMVDESGREIDVGAHFDHLDMELNARAYAGAKISAAARKNRVLREIAFQKAALSQGFLLAPLRSEFWHDQPPENREDLWRGLESVCRCLGMHLLTPEDEALRRDNREAFCKKWESWDYAGFQQRWHDLFKTRRAQLEDTLGTAEPPAQEKPESYHGNFHPIYDESLRTSGKHLTDSAAA